MPEARERYPTGVTFRPGHISVRANLRTPDDVRWLIASLTGVIPAAFPGSTVHDVVLTGYVEGAKIPVIKEIRAITGLGLKEAKDMSESLPSVVVCQQLVGDAERIRKALVSVGASVTVRPA